MNCSALQMFWNEEDGQDLIEYSLLLALVALVAITLLTGAGTSVKNIWTSINSQLTSATSAAGSGS